MRQIEAYRDIKNSIDTAIEKGRAEVRAEVAKAMLGRGMDIKTVSDLSGLSEEEVQRLLVSDI